MGCRFSVKSSDAMIADFVAARALRDKLRSERGACLCERSEQPDDAAIQAALEGPDPIEAGEPCWKAARQWDNNPEHYRARFHFDPPMSEWCATCQRRQALTIQLREAITKHAGALRGLMRRGQVLNRAAFNRIPGASSAVETDGNLLAQRDLVAVNPQSLELRPVSQSPKHLSKSARGGAVR